MAIKYSLLKSFPASPGIDSSADIPLTNNVIGDQLYVAETNRLYIWNGSGWYNIALINTAPSITNGAEANYFLATDGTPTVVTLTATDPEGIPITWSYAITSGSLGSTATISQADNVFTITPSTNTADAGSFGITFTASDGVNTATTTTSVTLVFTAASFKNVIYSADHNVAGTTNNSYVDRSTNALTITPSGTPYQSSFHPYLDNWSVEFDGDGDYLSIPANSAFDFGTGDYTIEFFLYLNTTGDFTIIDTQGAGGNAQISRISGVVYHAGDTWNYTFPNYVWTHIAFSRSGTSLRLFANGVLIETKTNSNAVGSSANACIIGRRLDAFYPLTGSISNLRVVKGTALYTSNFVHPTEKLTAVTGTSLLTCQSNRFIDNSTNSHAITVNGNPVIAAYNPLGQAAETLIGENKGSVYLDGNADYLTSATDVSLTFGTDPFTVSLWVYPEVVNDNDGVILIGSLHIHLYLGSWYIGTAGSGGTSIATATPFTWTHLALERDTANGAIKLYINGTSAGSVANANLTGNSLIVGYYYSSAYAVKGYVADVKVVKGTAVYGANFTPPTAPVGNTNASIYLPMDNPTVGNKAGIGYPNLYYGSLNATYTKYQPSQIAGALRHFGLIPARTADFTIEGWFLRGAEMPYLSFANESDANAGAIRITTENNFGTMTFRARLYDNAGNDLSNATYTQNNIAQGVWAHFALVRESTTAKLYVNGVLSQTNTVGTTDFFPTGIQTLHYGTGNDHGHSDVQILLGVAKYTANFTPPTAEQGIAYQAES